MAAYLLAGGVQGGHALAVVIAAVPAPQAAHGFRRQVVGDLDNGVRRLADKAVQRVLAAAHHFEGIFEHIRGFGHEEGQVGDAGPLRSQCGQGRARRQGDGEADVAPLTVAFQDLFVVGDVPGSFVPGSDHPQILRALDGILEHGGGGRTGAVLDESREMSFG